MRLVYFAWVRERLGKTDEDVALPGDVVTAEDLVKWLQSRGDEYAYAFENPETIRVAVDQEHVEPEFDIRSAREVALFPPMTGG